MGLSENKKKVKLSRDPNNTNWTRDTSSFGHKILASQGWKPGDYLGAANAAHAEFHGAANASHIRVVLKDDNLGLGAKKGGQNVGECSQIDAFSRLLGRLNSNDQDEYVQEEKRREELKKAIFTEQKWGSMRFVKGGFLIGDKVVELADAEKERVLNLGKNTATGSSKSDGEESSSGEQEEIVSEKEKKSKKSKDRSTETEAEKKKRKQEEKDKKKRKAEVEEEAEPDATEETSTERKLRQKEKKEKKRKAAEEEEAAARSTTKSSSKKRESPDDDNSTSKKSKNRRKAESKSTPDDPTETTTSRKHKDKKPKISKDKDAAEESEEDTPEPAARPAVLRGRAMLRARHIAQKRVSGMDAAALNQIFMIKG